MDNIKAKSIKKISPQLIKFIWSDGIESTIRLGTLRSNCPCAQCTSGGKGQSRLVMFVQQSLKQERNNLMELKPVGNYAIRPVWGDGHDIGIYRWDFLRILCEENGLSESDIEIINKKNNENESLN